MLLTVFRCRPNGISTASGLAPTRSITTARLSKTSIIRSLLMQQTETIEQSRGGDLSRMFHYCRHDNEDIALCGKNLKGRPPGKYGRDVECVVCADIDR